MEGKKKKKVFFEKKNNNNNIDITKNEKQSG